MPLFLQDWNWSDLFYVLLPILYVLSQFLGSKDKKKGDASDPATPDEAELAERRRRIQEEIRRRISGEAAPEAGQPPAEPARRVETEIPPQAAPRPVVVPPTPPQLTHPVSEPVPARSPAATAASDLEERLARQREALRESRLARDNARREADALARSTMGSIQQPPPGRTSAASPRADVLAALRSRRNVRAAVVLTEVLGPPAGLRREIGDRLF